MRRTLTAVLAGSLIVAGLASPSVSSPGVTKAKIRIGLHAAFTGAAPMPEQPVQRGADVYWEWLASQDLDIHGRDVGVTVKNDNSNPSQAVAVCKEMVEDDKVFMLAGYLQIPGHDQIQACARYAASVGVPYVSLGVMKTGLTSLPNYFALTMSHPEQAEMLADLLVDRMGAKGEVNGILWTDGPNWTQTHSRFIDAMTDRDATVEYDRAVSRNAGLSDANAIVQEMKLMGVQNVFVMVTPTFLMQLMSAAGSQEYEPQWTGIGINYSPDDSFVGNLCKNGSDSFEGARVLSPLPAFTDRDDYDKRFDRAMEKIYPGKPKDGVAWLGWAASRALHPLLQLPGRDLTRKRFISKAEKAELVTRIFPAMAFTPKDHFAGDRIHLLKADCAAERWKTADAFVKDF